jgi:hypothetical protein
MDSLFNPLWAKRYSNTGLDEFHDVQETSDGGYLIAAATGVPGNSVDVLLVRADASGTPIWSKTLGRTGDDLVQFVHPLADTGFVFLGSTSDNFIAKPGCYSVKADSTGNSCFTTPIVPVVTQVPITVDSFSFNISTLDSSYPASFVMSNGFADSLVCYNNGLNAISENEQSRLIISPNPTQGRLIISFHTASKLANLTLCATDIMGTQIMQEHHTSFTGKLSRELDLTNRAKGLYFIVLQADGETVVRKVLVK